MTSHRSAQATCLAGMARVDITPPVGIYHRMWGAALHDRAAGVHRPLLATALWLAPGDEPAASGRLILGLDHCVLDSQDMQQIGERIAAALSIPLSHVHVTLSHTHGSGWLSRQRIGLPGGELIEPYLEALIEHAVAVSTSARQCAEPITFVFGQGRCGLAAHRDFYDVARGHYVCGWNPAGPADDTLLVARLVAADGSLRGTIVNYACHPTTLAWDNRLLSPDWVGAMRATIEQELGGLCLFLQGASGDLGPRDGFVGDVAVADRNGRQVGFAALATLESLTPAGANLCYQGPVLSGTWIGSWSAQPWTESDGMEVRDWSWSNHTLTVPYRADLPSLADTIRLHEEAIQAESTAAARQDETALRVCRARTEQLARQRTRLQALAPGAVCPLVVTVGKLGDSLWVFTPGELYQQFQTELRARFAPRPVFVVTLTGDWQPGYIPPASTYGKQIYQEVIAATAPGSLEQLTANVRACLAELCE